MPAWFARAIVIGLFACMAGAASLAAAQDFPARGPIRLVAPFAPGGGTDVVARVLASGVAADLQQSVIVDNKPGAGTLIGTEAVARSAPDGYTLLVGTFAYAVNPSLVAKMPFDADRAFAPVILIGTSPNVLVVRPDRSLRNVADVIEYARSHPGKLSYGSFGNGTSAHLAAELFKNLAQVDLNHVPYRGASPAITDLLGGQIDLMFTTIASVSSFLKEGKLRALAVTSPQRSPALPQVPTIAEAGVPGYAAQSWYGILAPAGTPVEVVTRLNASFGKAARSDAFRERVADEGLVVDAHDPAELARFIEREQTRWSKVVHDAHLSAQ